MAWYNDIGDFGDALLDATITIGTGGLNKIYEFGRDIYDAQKEAEEAAKEARRQSRQARLDAMRDRKVSSNAGQNPRKIIYGQTRTGGQIVLEETRAVGANEESLNVIVVFAAHQCEELGDIYLDDSLFFKWNGSTHDLQPEFIRENGEKTAGIVFELGEQTEANPWIVGSVPSWTDSDKLLGQTYAYIYFFYDDEIYSSRRNNISAVINGKNDIYDPRTGATGYTDNQALCSLDYLRWNRGMNIPDAVIDMDSVKVAANICDELVTRGNGQTEKRYTVNGTAEFNAPPIDTLQSLDLAGASSWVRTAGQWFLVPGKYDDSGAIELTEDDLIGGIEFSPRTDKNNLANIARGTFVDPDQSYEAVDFVHLAVDDYIQNDREELVQNLDFPWTNSGTMARRISKIYLEKKRYGLVVGCTMKFKAIEIAPGDRIKLTISGLGWNQRVFRVERMQIDVGAGVKLALKEDNSAVWNWQEGDALAVDAPPALNVPDPRFTPAPTDLSVTEELYSGAELGSIRVRAELSWLPGGVTNRSYDVQYRIKGSPSWITAISELPATSVAINDLEPAVYEFRVRARNGLGVYSEWSLIEYQVLGKQQPPPRPDSLYINKGKLYWSLQNAPLDLAGYRVRYQNGDRSIWLDAIRLHDGLVTQTVFDVSELEGGQRTFLVKAVDTSGNESSEPAVLREGLGDPVVQNVIVEKCYEHGWIGAITGGSIVGGVIDANESSVFWNPDLNAVFWPENRIAEFWQTEYQQLDYEFSFTPEVTDIPSQLTITSSIRGNNATIMVKLPSSDLFWGVADSAFWSLDSESLFWGDSNFDYIEFGGAFDISRREEWIFKVVIPAQTAGSPTGIDSLCVNLDVPDITEALEDVLIQSGGTRLPILKDYRVIKNVGLTLQDDNTGALSVKIVDRDSTGPLVKIFDANNVSVSGTVDARIQGY